jgi:allantoinase
MKCDLLVRGERVFRDGEFGEATLGITDGTIEFVEESSRKQEQAERVIDAGNDLVCPGFVDVHVHFNDPGRRDWEGFDTGTRAAAAGGTTTVLDMPLNCSPTTTSLPNLREKEDALTDRAEVDYGLWGGFRGNDLIAPEERDRMAENVFAFKAFLSDSGLNEYAPLSESQLRDVLEWSGQRGQLVGFHAEWGPFLQDLDVDSSIGDPARKYLESRPVKAEKKAVERILRLADETDAPVHVVHVSSPEVVDLITDAKQDGVDVSLETCPHYLTFDEEDFLEQGAILKCAPPLRPRETVEALWDRLANGSIDLVASDHSPCPWEMRETESVLDAWGGIQNVQFIWLALLAGARERGIDLEMVVPLGTRSPAERFGLGDRKGKLEAGMDADFTIVSGNQATKVSQNTIEFRNKYSPYEGFEFPLRVKKTVVRGNVVFDDNDSTPEERIGVNLGTSDTNAGVN